jgi:hypothetical protein
MKGTFRLKQNQKKKWIMTEQLNRQSPNRPFAHRPFANHPITQSPFAPHSPFLILVRELYSRDFTPAVVMDLYSYAIESVLKKFLPNRESLEHSILKEVPLRERWHKNWLQ